MEEYSDLKFDGDLSFLNENLDAAKNAQKEQIIKNQLAKEDSVKLAREEIAKQEIAKEESSLSTREEFVKQELIRIEIERLAREEFYKQEAERKEIARLAKEQFDKVALEAENLRLEKKEEAEKEEALRFETNEIARQEAENLRLKNEEAEKEEALRFEAEEVARQEAENLRLKNEEAEKEEALRFEAEEVARQEALNEKLENEEAIKTPETYLSHMLTQNSIENVEKANETINSQSDNFLNENENYVSPKVEQGMVLNNGEKKSQLEEMILNSGYGVEMFNNLKLELLELEKEKIIMKYKQDLMMMIIKS